MTKEPVTRTTNWNWNKVLLLFRLFVTCSSYVLLVPVASAQDPIHIFDTPDRSLTFAKLADKIGGIANAVIPFLIGVAFVAIIWGIFKYILHAGDAEKVAEGRKMVIYGIVALFLMLSFWGFVMIITKSLGLN